MRWPPFEHIFFDCDSTLTTVEGIDVLAESMGKRQRVEILTQAAMDGTIELDDIYSKRLKTLRPTRRQVLDIRHHYRQNIVEDAAHVVAALQALGHKVYIISGGLFEPVAEFGAYLGVPRERIRAVGIAYNELSGHWWDRTETDDKRYMAYTHDALTFSNGKAQIVRELLGDQRGRSLLIGDGNSDLLASPAVDLFVGYGGVVTRPIVRDKAPVFIQCTSMAPLLGLAGGPAELRILSKWSMFYQSLSLKAHYLIQKGVLKFNDEHLETKFRGAFLPSQ
ncbi:MAG: HAD-IB family phosphatase [Anaerolineae bacterium]|nr:HAD-IB family phosphatase [Anaerolineae bacterium]RIK24469.1 MAG: haloacid dehalogenase [Anaerolineae bacterium]